MEIRRAVVADMDGINHLLRQVLTVHHEGRPDIFKGNAKKYTDEQLKELIADDSKPIFVGVDEHNQVLGYAFCVVQQHIGHEIMTDIKTLYIDDLCVEEKLRGQHIGRRLYEYVLEYARENGFYNVTLNVWALNESAIKFYEALGMKPQKIGMETIV